MLLTHLVDTGGPRGDAGLLEIALWLAALQQLLVATANVFAVRMFRYREHLQKVPGHVAQVFVVQNVFIMLTVLGMAALCAFGARELSEGGALARALCGFLSLFWGIRLVFQLGFYDREKRAQHRGFDVLFLATFTYLTVLYGYLAF